MQLLAPRGHRLVGLGLAVGETVILLHTPLPLVGVSTAMERESGTTMAVSPTAIVARLLCFSSSCLFCSRSRRRTAVAWSSLSFTAQTLRDWQCCT